MSFQEPKSNNYIDVGNTTVGGPIQRNKGQRLKFPKPLEYYQDNLSHSAKIAFGLIPTTAVWASLNGLNLVGRNKKPLKNLLPSLLAAYSQSVGLVGVADMYAELKRNLGVRVTLPKLYQAFSVLGYLFATIGHLTITHTGVGRVFFVFNAMFFFCYTYMAYLTMAYNQGLEIPSRLFQPNSIFNSTRHTVNVPALVGWVTLNVITTYIWINEGRKSITTTYKNELLAALGFLIQSIGNTRAGFTACMTSNPEIQPFDGAMTIFAANFLAMLSLVTLAKGSPVARVYIAGYMSVLYNTLINAYYAFKQEREEKRLGTPVTPSTKMAPRQWSAKL